MRAVSEGRLGVTPGFGEAMTLCLGCLACQTACPAGVPFGELLEMARHQAEARQKRKRFICAERLRNWLLSRVVYGPRGLERLMPLLRFYQNAGLQRMNLARALPGKIGTWERMVPRLQPKSAHQALGDVVPAAPPFRGRVGLLTGCLENSLLAGMCIATAKVLAHNGFEVVIPAEQVCCGALPAHLGELELARNQARRNIDVFQAAGVRTVISDAAGCSGHLKEYGRLLSDDPNYAFRAARFSENSRDSTEFLAEQLPLRGPMRRLELRVTYDDPCHLIHGQGISLQPRELLTSIPGVHLIELPEASWCCGSAGTYNLTHAEESNALLMRKLAHVKAIRPDVLATANSGCYIQLAAGVREAGIQVEVLHVNELLARAYGLIQ
jgi:glycolate oxidase iron-sulfur subunit